jgi:uncharacterized protein
MMTYINRDLEPVLLEMMHQFPAIAITGPRQSGKSTLLRHVFPERHYVSLDDPLARQQATDDPELLLDSTGDGIIIDEVQHSPSLLPHLKMRIDRDRDAKGRCILTGSQQFASMKSFSETLAGRIRLLELPTFSIAEASKAGISSVPRETFLNSCVRGLFPEMVTTPSLNATRWYSSYVQTYLERDIRSMYEIGNMREFERFLQLLAARCAQQLNMSALAADAGVAVNTIKRWISILETCRIIFLLPPYYNNLGKRIIKAPKVYFLDCALVCYLTRLQDADQILKGLLSGPLFENFCIQEAFKAMVAQGVPPRMQYLRTKSGLEVDLLLESANGRLKPFEFKLSQTPRQEMGKALSRFQEEFAALKPENGSLVTLSGKTGRLTRNTSLVSFFDFCSEVPNLAKI